MKHFTKVVLGLFSTLLAVNIALADERYGKSGQHKYDKGCESTNRMSGEMGVDAIARANKHLNELKTKLNLTSDQQPAWQAFSDQINEQAKNMATLQNKMKDRAKNMPMTLPMSVPEQMAKMAEQMKERAQDMGKMADTVNTFYAALTPEQQVIFDKTHMNQMSAMRYKSRDYHRVNVQYTK